MILAGYRDRMATFFQYNPGFRSRVAHHISFPDYTLEELVTIAELMLREQNYSFDDEARQAFVEYLELRITQPQFANARSVRNAIDRMKLRQASRLVYKGGCVDKAELVRIAARRRAPEPRVSRRPRCRNRERVLLAARGARRRDEKKTDLARNCRGQRRR